MTLGPALVKGVPNAVSPLTCGTRQGPTAIPHVFVSVEYEFCVVRTDTMLVRLKMLKASQAS